jgi:hypothetical protein
MVKEAPDYKGLVDRVHRPDIFREVGQGHGRRDTARGHEKETLFDGVTFEPGRSPRMYVKSFPSTRWRDDGRDKIRSLRK